MNYLGLVWYLSTHVQSHDCPGGVANIGSVAVAGGYGYC